MDDVVSGTVIGFVDCESTGIGHDDEPISIGVVLVRLDTKFYGEPIAEWYGEQEPRGSIHPAAQRVHGRSRESLAGKAFDVAGLRAVLDQAEILIAHQASFDARMILKVIPDLLDWEWRCTRRQWPWREMENKKLDTVCAHFGIERPATHEALADAHALRLAVMQRSGKTERSRTYMHRLLSRGECDVRPRIRSDRPEPSSVTFVPPSYSPAPDSARETIGRHDRPLPRVPEVRSAADHRKKDIANGVFVWAFSLLIIGVFLYACSK